MSYHNECGEAVHWARRPDDQDRFMPPLEFLAMAVVLDENGVGREVPTYRQHRCDPVKVREWQDYQVKMSQVLGGAEAPFDDLSGELQTMARGRAREETYAEARTWSCPTCEAPAGEDCRNLVIMRKTGELVPTKDAHLSRQKLSYA